MWPFRRKRGRSLFRSYELAVIDALGAAMPAAAAPLYHSQVARLELVQRLFDDQDVQTYPSRRGPQRHDPALAFPNRSPELRLATVSVQGSGGTGRVTVHAVDGHVFSYAFRPPPRALGLRHSMEVTGVRLHADPMRPDDEAPAAQLLQRLAPGIRVELERAWAERPAWARDLVEPDGVYEIELEDGSFAVVAQLPDTTFVVAGLEAPAGRVRRYEPDGTLAGEYAAVEAAIRAKPT